MTITAKEKFETAKREVAYRRRVYARLIANGRMTQQKADREIAVMQAIADDYAGPAQAEDRAGRLF